MRLLWVISSAFVLGACGTPGHSVEAVELAETETAVVAGAAGATQAAAPAETDDLRMGGVVGKVPRNWKTQAPVGQFRVGQYLVPPAPGVDGQALFIVFHFGKGGGGTVPDNVQRWRGMMKGSDDGKGGPAPKTMARDGLKITTLELHGTYQDRPFPFSQQVTERPGYRMLAAIVETTKEGGDGPYYLRIVGPGKTVDAAKAGWDRLVETLRWDP